MPQLSIIIPVYNIERYLCDCLDSFLTQSLNDIEVICVNDGSTDSSGFILDEYAAKDSRVTVIHKQNIGAGAARNTGLEYATGEYVLFFDSDDYILEGALEKLYRHACAKDADITICKSLQCFELDRQLSELPNTVNTQFLNGKTDFSARDIADYIYQFCAGWPWDKLYKLSFIKENNLEYQNLRHSNDTYFVLLSLSLADKISLIEESLVVHRQHGKSLAATREKAPDCFYFALRKLYEGLESRNLYACFEKSFVNYCVTFPYWHLTTVKDERAQEMMFEKIIKLLTFIHFENYPPTYFYHRKEYKAIKKMWDSKNYRAYKKPSLWASFLSVLHLK